VLSIAYNYYVKRQLPPVRVPEDCTAYRFQKASNHAFFIFAIIVGSVADIPLTSQVGGFITHSSWVSIAIAIFNIVGAIYAIIWLASDWVYSKNAAHWTADGKLHLDLSFWCRGTVDIAEILSVSRWSGGRRPRPSARVTPFEPCNVIIHFRSAAAGELQLFGAKRKLPPCLLMYVDEPARFVTELNDLAARRAP